MNRLARVASNGDGLKFGNSGSGGGELGADELGHHFGGACEILAKYSQCGRSQHASGGRRHGGLNSR